MNKIIFPKIDLENVKGVLIDIDNTLYPYNPAHEKAIKDCHNEFIKKIKEGVSFDNFYNHYRAKRIEVTKRLYPQGSCRSRLFAFQSFFEELGDKNAFINACKFETLYWKSFNKNMILSDNAYKFLLECRSKNIQVCAISDMQTYYQTQKLKALKIDHLINFLVTSEEAGVEKPGSQIFLIALKKLNLKFNDVIMVGDDKEKDIKGAEALKIKSYLVNVNYD